MVTSQKKKLFFAASCAVGVTIAVISSRTVVAAAPAGVDRVAMAYVGLTGGTSNYTYVGSKKCKKCHIKQYKSWSKTRMGNAFDILKPGTHAEAKKKFNVDVNKDFTKDEKCLKCHTVGLGKPGGYVIPDPSDKKSVRKAKKLANVGCESCHGPGSGYIKVFEDILKSKRKYKREELYAVGLTKIDETTCKTCHNEESPTVNPGDTFDFEKRKHEGTHEHFPLKQREE